jgi:fumarate reductase subunit C
MTKATTSAPNAPAGSAPGSRPRQYVRTVPGTWWLKKRSYTKFMVRELSSAFIAAYALFLLVPLCAANDVPAFHRVFLALKSPQSVVLHLIVMVFALFHTITFFNLTPRAIVLRFGEEKVPEAIIQVVHYALWGLVSIALLALALRG